MTDDRVDFAGYLSFVPTAVPANFRRWNQFSGDYFLARFLHGFFTHMGLVNTLVRDFEGLT